eukprot:gnl/MRDRNA2_/MRDRNA2_106186_c0_seq1.p1 gnl/MRDRNA2_/MRDRNA2_106186_c0~~gnl/MRDRNA2_/MRDRNA2_106186_c0_seq1.p1  ORF type:complete len:2339 (+),score=414.96 gnl/MRDRNA2_/MRDRNA2_106186_c0_seq1:214-7017(+)
MGSSTSPSVGLHGQEQQCPRVMAVGEDDVPASVIAKFLQSERGRYFGLQANRGVAGRRPSASPGRDPTRKMSVHGSSAPEVGAQPRRTCLVIVCRSPSSFRTLAMRCVFVQHFLSAPFLMQPRIALQQVALRFLPGRLDHIASFPTTPKIRRKSMGGALKHQKQTQKLAGAPPKSRTDRTASVGNVEHAFGKEVHEQLLGPLAQTAEQIQVKIQQRLTHEYGEEFAREFCTPCRYFRMLQTFGRLSRHRFAIRRQKKRSHVKVLATLGMLSRTSEQLNSELRAIKVSLHFLQEEARRLTSEVTKVTAEKNSMDDALKKTREAQRALDSRVAEVDGKYGGRFQQASAALDAALRALQRLDLRRFEELGKFVHPPPPIVKTLQIMYKVVVYSMQLSDPARARALGTQGHEHGAEAGLEEPTQAPAADELENAAIEGNEGGDAGADEAAGGVASSGVGDLQIADGDGRLTRRTQADLAKWQRVVATKDVLEHLEKLPARGALAPWLQASLERYVSDPTCHPYELLPLSTTASHLAAWLIARSNYQAVLVAMETKRHQSAWGDLSDQMSTLSDEVGAVTAQLAKTEGVLAERVQRHTQVVQERQEQRKNEQAVQSQVSRIASIQNAFIVRRRECEVQNRQLQEEADQWGGLLYVSALSSYGAAFNPAVRMAIMRDVTDVLTDSNIPPPKDVHLCSHFKRYLPSSFMHLVHTHWHDTYMQESVSSLEIAGARCNLVLDPFDCGEAWLRTLYTQEYPSLSSGRLWPHNASVEINLQSSQPGQKLGRLGESMHEKQAKAKQDIAGPQPPVVVMGSDSSRHILHQLQRCMRDGRAMVIRLHAIAQLHGFIGTLLILLQTADARVKVRSTGASSDFRVRPKPNHTQNARESSGARVSTPARNTRHSLGGGTPVNLLERQEDESCDSSTALQIRLFDLHQQLENALPLPYRRFQLFVLVPACPWNAIPWGPMRQKKAEHIAQLPSMLWSVCNVVSLDSRPVHPYRSFLHVFAESHNAVEAERLEKCRAAVATEGMRLHVVEDIVMNLVAYASTDVFHNEVLCHDIHHYDTYAARLADSVASKGNELNRLQRLGLSGHLQLAGTTAVLLCALMDAELFRQSGGAHASSELGASHTDVCGDLSVHVGGFSTTVGVMRALLKRHLHEAEGPSQAMSQLFETVLCACSERHAATLRAMLLLEGQLVRNGKLAKLWDSLVRRSSEIHHLGVGISDEKSEGGRQHGSGSRMGMPSSARSGSAGDTGSQASSSEGQAPTRSPQGSDEFFGSDQGDEQDDLNEEEEEELGSGSTSEVSPGYTPELRSESPPVVADTPSPELDDMVDSPDTLQEPRDPRDPRVSGLDVTLAIAEGDDAGEEYESLPDVDEQRSSQGSLGSAGIQTPISEPIEETSKAKSEAPKDTKSFPELLKELCITVDSSFPPARAERTDVVWRMARVPCQVPVMIPHDGLPVVTAAARLTGAILEEQSAISMAEHNLTEQICSILAHRNTWLLFDLADVTDFNELVDFIQHCRWRRAQDFGTSVVPARTGVEENVLEIDLSGDRDTSGNLLLQEDHTEVVDRSRPDKVLFRLPESSRLFLFSSAERTAIPSYVMQMCFCVQNFAHFFGILPSLPDGSSADEEVFPEDVEVDILEDDYASGAQTDFDPRASSVSSHSRGGRSSFDDAIRDLNRHKKVAATTNRAVSLLAKNFSNNKGPMAGEYDRKASPFFAAAMDVLSYAHPLLTAQPVTARDERLMAAMMHITETVKSHGDLEEMMQCSVVEIPQWIGKHVVLRAHSWVQRSAMRAMFHSFSPALLRQNERQAKETLRYVSGKIGDLLNRVSASASSLTANSPFWLRLELFGSSARLRNARADIAACHSALLGDVQWNSRIFAVYTSIASGRSIWDEGRPLSDWLASLERHALFLTSWRQDKAADSPFRIASVNDINSFFSSYRNDELRGEEFHLRLERRGQPQRLALTSDSESGRPSSSLGHSGSTQGFDTLASPVSDAGRGVRPRSPTAASQSVVSRSSLQLQQPKQEGDALSPRLRGDSQLLGTQFGHASTTAPNKSSSSARGGLRRVSTTGFSNYSREIRSPTTGVRPSVTSEQGGSPRTLERESTGSFASEKDGPGKRLSVQGKEKTTRKPASMSPMAAVEESGRKGRGGKRRGPTEVSTSTQANFSSGLMVDDLHLVGATWLGGKIVEESMEANQDFETVLPPMVIKPVKGPAPKSSEWFACPLIIAKADACGADLISTPAAYVMLRTAIHPSLCAIRGVRLVTYS